jgi:ABC-type transport system substrate-binding protein
MYSAFRTGKVDAIGEWQGQAPDIGYEDMLSIVKTNPETKVKEDFASGMPVTGIRLTSTDPLAAPLLNQRVRWALSMSIDRDAMVRDLMDDAATKYVFFFPPTSQYYQTPAEMVEVLETKVGIPHEEAIMVEKIFEYNPEEAKKILAEEGYPDGFQTEVISDASHIDLLSVMAGYFAEIGVDMAMDIRDFSVYRSIIDSHNTKAMFYYSAGYGTNPAKWVFYGPGDPTKPFTVSNRWELSHPILDDYIQRCNAIYGTDLHQQNTLLQEAEAWIVWMAPWIGTPGPHEYSLWHPWLKNYFGFEAFGFRNHWGFSKICWLDLDLKEEMTGRR